MSALRILGYNELDKAFRFVDGDPEVEDCHPRFFGIRGSDGVWRAPLTTLAEYGDVEDELIDMIDSDRLDEVEIDDAFEPAAEEFYADTEDDSDYEAWCEVFDAPLKAAATPIEPPTPLPQREPEPINGFRIQCSPRQIGMRRALWSELDCYRIRRYEWRLFPRGWKRYTRQPKQFLRHPRRLLISEDTTIQAAS
ncbi:MAG: hypothetical protein ACOZBH_03690 [Patescibacteria group bacterium]